MKPQLFTIKDIVHITGITKRTLHHYHKIGLLHPSHIGENGYRLYDRHALATLQMILLFKEMGFSLTEISTILPLSKDEQTEILLHQRGLLERQKQKLTTVIEQLDHYIEGTDIQKLNIFDDSSTFSIKDQYDQEAKLVYGDTEKYQEFQANIEYLSDSDKKEEYKQFPADIEHIFHRVAQYQQLSPSANEVQDLIGQWSRVLGRFMVCDEAILLGIAETYVIDERFVRYFDQFGEEGYLDFLYRSIVYFVKENKQLSNR